MTSRDLLTSLHVDGQVQEILLPRPVPANNAYWYTRTEYILLSPGYYFIPLFFDLLIKQGATQESVLFEAHLLAMEEILNSVAQFERNKISFKQHLATCRTTLLKYGRTNEQIRLAENLLVNKPFDKVPTHYKALSRANTFLYASSMIQFDNMLLAETWESIMPLLLFLDDIEDLKSDQETNQENSLLEGASPEESFFQLHPVFLELTARIRPINPAIFQHLNTLREQATIKGLQDISLR